MAFPPDPNPSRPKRAKAFLEAIAHPRLIQYRCFTISPEIDICRAVAQITRKNLCGAPVVDAKGMYVGAFCEKKLMNFWIESLYNVFPPAAVHSMLVPLPTVGRDVGLPEILDCFHESCLCRLDVVEEGRFLGVITRKRVLAFLKGQLGVCTPPEKPKRLFLSAKDREGGDLKSF